MESMDEVLARKTVKNYSCSNCWGDLELVPDMRENGMYFVVCQKCKDETKGYVTKYFVDQRRNQNEFERMDATRLLNKLGIIQDDHHTPLRDGETKQERNMRELGF